MKICLYLKNSELKNKLSNFLDIENKTTSFNNFIDIYNEIFFMGNNFDLIIADITFQQSNKSLQDQLSKNEVFIPIIFYNDPYMTKEDRNIYWFKQNIRALDFSRIEDENYEYNVLFKKLDNYLLGIMEKQLESKNFYMKSRLTPAMSRLFNCFYSNIHKEIEACKIIQILSEKSNTKLNLKSIYTYISRLKKEMETKFPEFKIIRTGQETYAMVSCDI